MGRFSAHITSTRLYIAGAIALLICAVFSKGYHHFDEHFQILEFAALKLQMATAADMPWEYTTKMRSGIQPFLVVGLYKLIGLLGTPNPFIIALLLRVISAIAAFFTSYKLVTTFGSEVNNKYYLRLFLPLSFLLWFDVYNAVRFSSENWSAICLALAVCVLSSSKQSNLTSLILSGLLMGFGVLIRFQAGFMIAGVLLWLLIIKKESIARVAWLVTVIILVIALGVLIDKWLYGVWTLSCWNYFDQNILQDKVSGFGVHPWWYYFVETFKDAIPPFSLLFIGGLFGFLIIKPKHIFSFLLVPFLVVHLLIGHKELRFMFPVIYFLPLCVTVTFQYVTQKYNVSYSNSFISRILIYSFSLAHLTVLLIVMFKPADSYIGLYEKIYNQYAGPTVLYYENENPYNRVLDIHFYKRANLCIRKVNTLNDIALPADTTVLVATTQNNIDETVNLPHTCVYASLPNWVNHFNYNNWLARTKIWHVYEIKPQ